jgi:hypothetical protein
LVIRLSSGGFSRAAAAAFFSCAIISSPALAAAPGPVACAGARPAATPLASQHLASLPKYDTLAPISGAVKAVKSGAWSDGATWGGKLPTTRAFIPKGVGVVFDLADSAKMKSVRVEGCLELSNRVSSRLNTEFLYVAPGGELLAGSQSAPIPANIVAEIVFPDLGPLDVKVDPTLVGKGLVSTSRARLYGALKSPRAKVSTAPRRGDTVIKLATTPSGWRVGDRVILTGTRWIKQTTQQQVVLKSPTEDEVRFIKAISGASVTLDAALAFDHLSPDPAVGAYLVNYSRNIRLATENGAAIAKTQRGHSMFMSTETTVEGVEFFEMGRTDKSIRAVDAATLTSPTPTSNVKGRYPLHLHQSGFPADDVAPFVRGVAVWGSPGWGVAQHAGNAFLFQNNTWNTFGAGFVAESGNEIGAWVENTAIKGIGVNHIVKDVNDVAAYDLGRTGDGFWLQSRSVRLHKNLAVGMTGGMGFVYFHRNNDLGNALPLTPSFTANALCTPSTMRFKPQPIEAPQIAQFTDNEVIASEVGFHVVKPRPIEPHDIRSMIDGFRAWEVAKGVELTYTSRYTVENSLLIASPAATDTIGVDFGMNTYDLAVANTKIAGFHYGVNLSKASTRTFASNSRYTIAGVTFSGIKVKPLLNQDATDQVLTSMPAAVPARVAFNWGTGPIVPTTTALYVYIQGTKTDSSGATAYPVATQEFLVNYTNFKGLAAERGWHTLTSGGRALVVPEYYSDRLTGEIFQTSFVMKPGQYFAWPSKLLNGLAADQGSLDIKAGPPTAVNDAGSVSANGAVTIAALANDRTNDGKLLASGHGHARDGNVMQLANGDFRYTPFPDFRGTDKFDYWVRNRQGVVARGTVTVTVR